KHRRNEHKGDGGGGVLLEQVVEDLKSGEKPVRCLYENHFVGNLGLPRFFQCAYAYLVALDLGMVLRAQGRELLLELGQKLGLLSPDRARAAYPGASVPCGLPLDLLKRVVSLAFLLRYSRC